MTLGSEFVEQVCFAVLPWVGTRGELILTVPQCLWDQSGTYV
jgi:hypothetical protein